MELLLNELLEDLKTELGLTETKDIAILSSKIKSAIREVKFKRNYPDFFNDEQIEKDLYNHYSIIREVSLYDYNQFGVEGQTSHNDNGTNRTWKDRNSCFYGLVAFCR